MTPLHKAARDWASAGFFVFPVVVGRKEPAIKNNLELATTDLDQIDKWWAEADYNIGCAPDKSGNSVLDVDPPLGFVSLQALEAIHGGMPPTRTMTTPRGGVHYWFDGEIPSGASKLGPKLDTRGVGGYVLMPPSVVYAGEYDNNPNGGAYNVKDNVAEAELPAWIKEGVAAERSNQLSGSDDLDTPQNIGRLRYDLARLVAKGDVAIAESGGKDRTYRLCCEALDLGVSVEKAAELIFEIWNPACLPPWEPNDPEGVEVMLANALKYRQNEVGAYAVEPSEKVFAGSIAGAQDDTPMGAKADKTKEVKSRFRLLDEDEQNEAAEPVWLLKDLVQADSLCVVYGAPKSFKSFLVLDICLGIAAGVSTFGMLPEQGSVVYCAGEGSNNISRKHRPAWRLARGIEPDRKLPFYVVPRVPFVTDRNEVLDLVKQIRARCPSPAVVVIDTVARASLGLEENSSKDVGMFIAACDLLREELGCTVIAIHHAGKDTARGSRGSNALEGAVDTVLEVRRHEKSKYVSLTVREQRNAQEREEPFTFIGHEIGPSLAFDPCDMGTFMAAIEAGKVVTSKNIGTILQRLNARSYDAGLTSAILCAELERDHGGDAKQYAKELTVARKKNEGVSNLSDGDPLRWHLVG